MDQASSSWFDVWTWLWNRFDVFSSFSFCTMCIELLPPVFRCASRLSLWVIITDAFLTTSLLFINFFLALVSFSFMSPKMDPWSKKRKGNSLWCFNSQDSHPHARLKLRFFLFGLVGEITWSSGNHLFHFLTSHVAHPTLKWIVSKELRSTFSSRNLWLRREARLDFFFLPKGPPVLSSNTGRFTLHSDQSFPNTPSRLCSRIGIDPGKKEHFSAFKIKSFCIVYFTHCG